MTNTIIKISVFLNTWGNYNENGADGGFWVELPCNLDEAMERLAASTGEEVDEMEVFINDTDIEGIDLEIDENDNLEELNEMVEELQNLDEYDLEKVEAIIEVHNVTIKEAIEDIDNYTYYSNTTLKDLAYDFVEEGLFGDIADNLKNYIDYEAIARDLSYDGCTETKNGVLC